MVETEEEEVVLVVVERGGEGGGKRKMLLAICKIDGTMVWFLSEGRTDTEYVGNKLITPLGMSESVFYL
uniref:Uncharacterized protein n=1 Tax=Vespula pensylvanica TaxID=30213 RepID=A0A834NYK2_VESPE|nr:hypothetical protein H0235_009302 [Vespula pensylvanica]